MNVWAGLSGVFGKASRALLERRTKNILLSSEHLLRNFDEDAVKEEFRRRFLDPFTTSIASEINFESQQGIIAAAKALPAMLPVAAGLAVAGVAAPIAFVAIAGVAIRHVFVSMPRVDRAFDDAAEALTAKDGPRGVLLQDAEAWMDKNIDALPGYLDRLDRREEDLRKRKKILSAIANGKAEASLALADRALLKKYDARSFKIRAENPISLLPHQALLGNRHHTHLYNALRRDIRRQAGSRASLFKQTLMLTGPK